MTCPSCSGPTHVIDSRGDGDGVRYRRRRCSRCSRRFSTYEISAVEYARVQAMRVNPAQIDATIATLRAIKAQFGGNGEYN